MNLTMVAPVNVVPVMTTVVPTGPLVGENADTYGATLKGVAAVAVPPAVVTVRGPVVAPTGTLVAMLVPELLVMVAAVPLKLTVAPARLVPVMVTATRVS